MLSTPLRVLARTAFLLSTAALASASCSRQGEGDRCDYAWAGPDQDCQSDLICTPCGNLQDGVVDRCCRRDGTVTDSRCTAAASPTNLTCNTHTNLGSAGFTASTPTAGAGGTSGSGGTSAAGGTPGMGGKSSSGGSSGTDAAGGNAGQAGSASSGG